MQNAIAPVAPTTPTPPVESKPSPRAPASHAFATLLKQSQNAAPAPAKAVPVAPARSDGAVDGSPPSTTTRAAAKAAMTTDARRADATRSDAGRVEARRADKRADDGDAATSRKDKDGTSSTGDGDATGTGVAPTHGLVSPHRLAAAPAEGASTEAAGRAASAAPTSADEHADVDAATTSTSAPQTGGVLASRGPAVGARDDDAPARTGADAGAGAGAGDKIAFAPTETSPGRTLPFAPSELRTEATAPAAPAPATEAMRSGNTATVDATVTTPVASPDFSQAFAVQVSVLVQDGVQSAELHLNPVETGPVSVQIVVDGTQARIEFGADALATRQAIEAGLPELAASLRDAGMTLQGGGVSQHARDPNAEPWRGNEAAGLRAIRHDDELLRAGPVLRQSTVAADGVDLYA